MQKKCLEKAPGLRAQTDCGGLAGVPGQRAQRTGLHPERSSGLCGATLWVFSRTLKRKHAGDKPPAKSSRLHTRLPRLQRQSCHSLGLPKRHRMSSVLPLSLGATFRRVKLFPNLSESQNTAPECSQAHEYPSANKMRSAMLAQSQTWPVTEVHIAWEKKSTEGDP